MQEVLQKMYPGKNIVNLVPERMYNSTVFSEFIKKYWSQVKFAPKQNIINHIGQEIMYRLQYLVQNKDKSIAPTQKMLQQWYSESNDIITAWQIQHANGVLSEHQFMENIKDNMLQFEIRRNAIRQSLLSQRNAEEKQEDAIKNADFIMSTIHSAKGLEFDNTVVVYQNENKMSEEKKRMYYVAFTRAMKSECIIAFDKVNNPKIQGDYDIIVKTLENKENSKSKGRKKTKK